MKINLFCLLILAHQFCLAQSFARISGIFLNPANDTVSLWYNDHAPVGIGMEVKLPIVNNRFHYTMTVKHSTYISISDGKNYIDGVVEPGDRISIKGDFTDSLSVIQFDGKGKEKFEFLQLFIPLFAIVRDNLSIAKMSPRPVDFLYRIIDSVENVYTTRLDKYIHTMTKDSYYLLQGGYQAQILRNRYNVLMQLYNESIFSILKKRNAFTAPNKKKIESLLMYDERYFRSDVYPWEVSKVLDDIYGREYQKEANNLNKKYSYVINKLPPKLKVPVVSHILYGDIEKKPAKEELDNVIAMIFTSPTDSFAHNYIKRMMDDVYSLHNGDQAPAFSLTNSKDEKIILSDFKGKVVYLDFWFGACPPCHAQFDSLKTVKQYFEDNDQVVFLNISIDDKETWKAALQQYNIRGNHAYTENKKMEHPVIKDYKVYSYPSNRLVGKDGRIFMVVPSSNPRKLIMQITDALNIQHTQ